MHRVSVVFSFALCTAFLLAGCSDHKNEPAAVPSSSKSSPGIPFSVEGTAPLSGAVSVGVNDPVSIVFSSGIDVKSAESGIVIFSPSGKKVEGKVSCMGKTAEFKANELLEYGAVYKAVVGKTVADTDGNTLRASYSWSFTTDAGFAPQIRVLNGSSIVLSDITGYDYFGQDVNSQSAPVTFTVKNEGTASLVIKSISIVSGAIDQFSLSAPSSPVIIAPGKESSFSIVFHPLSAGKKTAYLKILSNDANAGFFNLMITGKGV